MKAHNKNHRAGDAVTTTNIDSLSDESNDITHETQFQCSTNEATLVPAHRQPIPSPKLSDLEIWMDESLTRSFHNPDSRSNTLLQPCIESEAEEWHVIAQPSLDSLEAIDLGFLQQTSTSPIVIDQAAQNPPEPHNLLDWPNSVHSAHFSHEGNLYGDQNTTPTMGTTDSSDRTMSPDYYKLMQEEISKSSSYSLPPRKILCSFIDRYFSSFHRHQPFLHKPTWSPNGSPFTLVLAVCANGAVYNLEYSTSQDLYLQATLLLSNADNSITALQTMMLLTAFSAWTGNAVNISTAFQFHTRIGLALGREWASRKDVNLAAQFDWNNWREMESLRR